mmetsp:Transcript_24416/g.67878  ORF Transcript_24416/g.67878 Transcript_24416/m.67878 type:complete len:271 (+) Transcript_24416:772-1584(+)
MRPLQWLRLRRRGRRRRLSHGTWQAMGRLQAGKVPLQLLHLGAAPARVLLYGRDGTDHRLDMAHGLHRGLLDLADGPVEPAKLLCEHFLENLTTLGVGLGVPCFNRRLERGEVGSLLRELPLSRVGALLDALPQCIEATAKLILNCAALLERILRRLCRELEDWLCARLALDAATYFRDLSSKRAYVAHRGFPQVVHNEAKLRLAILAVRPLCVDLLQQVFALLLQRGLRGYELLAVVLGLPGEFRLVSKELLHHRAKLRHLSSARGCIL